jgi:two-component system, OmpR family, response regulator
MKNYKVLIAEDDKNLLDILRYNLEKEGYQVVTAQTGVQALEKTRSEKPDLLILDIMLPEIDGFEICRIIRKEMTIPILMLTAKADEVDKIVGLELGADDYMTKPFSTRELLARIKAMLRRVEMVSESLTTSSTTTSTVLEFGELKLDTARHVVTRNNTPVDLGPKEFDLLAFLMLNKGQVFSRDTLLDKVWGYEFTGDTRTVDVHVRWLRQKIEASPEKPVYLCTIRGVGYKFEG